MDSKTATIADYKRFFIQTNSDLQAIDTKSAYGMIAKSNPYPIMPTPKELYSNEWKDASGDDEYVAGMVFESMEITVDFYVACEPTISNAGIVTATAVSKVRAQVNSFFDSIKGSSFRIFDEYTGLGFSGVRYAGYEEGEFKCRNRNVKYADRNGNILSKLAECASLIFSVTFKVNNPTSRCSMTGTSIIDLIINN